MIFFNFFFSFFFLCVFFGTKIRYSKENNSSFLHFIFIIRSGWRKWRTMQHNRSFFFISERQVKWLKNLLLWRVFLRLAEINFLQSRVMTKLPFTKMISIENKNFWAIQIFYCKWISTRTNDLGPFSRVFPGSWLVETVSLANLKKTRLRAIL